MSEYLKDHRPGWWLKVAGGILITLTAVKAYVVGYYDREWPTIMIGLVIALALIAIGDRWENRRPRSGRSGLVK